MTQSRLVRRLFMLGTLCLCWAVWVMWTGGIVVHVGGVRISSRGARNPALLGALSLALAWIAAPHGRRRATLAAEYHRLAALASLSVDRVPAVLRRPVTIAFIASIGVAVIGVTEGTFATIGADSYGYVSQAHLWSIGELRRSPPLARDLGPSVPLDWQAPLGYRPSADGLTIAPIYSPGLPMVMAIFERVSGPESVFWVVPLLASVLVWATYCIGKRVYGPTVGAVAAVLVATSPPVLNQLTDVPMSDLPAAAWWTLAISLVCLDRRAGALGGGAAAGIAVLTRPNLVPLVAVVGGLMLVRLVSTGRPLRALIEHSILFAIFTVSACIAVAIINHVLWGSVLVSGYGSLNTPMGFRRANVLPNLLLYPRVIAVQMPVVLALPLAAWLRKRSGDRIDESSDRRIMTVALWCWIALEAALYLSYPAFDSAWNLRFLLPAIPPLIILASVAALSLPWRPIETRAGVCVLALTIIGGYGMNYARDLGAFRREPLRRSAVAGAYIKQALPERAVLLSMLHSGSAMHYSGKPSLRWDLVPPSRLDPLVDELIEHGYVPYLVVDELDRADFQSRYRGHSRLAALDWAPLVVLGPELSIYAIPPRP